MREGRADSIADRQPDDAVRRFANVLRNAGTRHDERIALIAPDSRWLSTGFWGAIAAGAVPVPVNTLLNPADFRYVVNDCGARIAVVDPRIVNPSDLASIDVEVRTGATPAQDRGVLLRNGPWQVCWSTASAVSSRRSRVK